MPLASYRANAEAIFARSTKSQRWERSDRVLSGVAAERPPNSFWTASCASLRLL